MRLEKKIIALDSTIEEINDDIKEIDTQIDNIKYIYKSINVDIHTINSTINLIYGNTKKIDVTVSTTLDIIKEINNRVLNNHTEIVYRLDANSASVGDLNTKITNLLAQINKRNTKLKTAQKSIRPHKTSAHPNNED